MPSQRRSRRRHGSGASERKTLQLCAQVRRTLELTLAGDVRDDVLLDLAVERVEPAPDDRRLRVVLAAHGAAAARPEAEVRARLEAARGLLLEELARGISRRKLPELAFEIVRGGLPVEPDPERGEGWEKHS